MQMWTSIIGENTETNSNMNLRKFKFLKKFNFHLCNIV